LFSNKSGAPGTPGRFPDNVRIVGKARANKFVAVLRREAKKFNAGRTA
jgi:hypothetical protein